MERREKQEIFYNNLKEEFSKLLKEENLLEENIEIIGKSLTPEEAIGNPKRRDFPILTGKEVMLEAKFKNAKGQAFTDSPAEFKGSLKEIMKLDLVEDSYGAGIFIAALNSVMKYLGKVEGTVHCKNEEPEYCAEKLEKYLKENHNPKKITLVGYQPSMIEKLRENFQLRVRDLNPENIGKIRYGVKIEDGKKEDYDALNRWPDLVLCTGSTICNGSIVDFLELEKPVVFFGMTIAGAAELLGLERVCFTETFH